jgi:hypothetical protein
MPTDAKNIPSRARAIDEAQGLVDAINQEMEGDART